MGHHIGVDWQFKPTQTTLGNFLPHSLGLLYSAFTYYCGFKVNSGEYKLMGLATAIPFTPKQLKPT